MGKNNRNFRMTNNQASKDNLVSEQTTDVQSTPAQTPSVTPNDDIVSTHISFDISDPVNSIRVIKEAEKPVLYAPTSVNVSTPVPEANQTQVAAPVPTTKISQIDFSVNPFTTVGAKLAFEELKHYVEAMLNKKIALTAQQGAVYQASLYRALVGAINAPSEEFQEVMDFFLAVINQHLETIFAPHSVFRFMNGMVLPKQAVMHFRHLINMFVAMAPPKSRRLAIKQSGLPNVLNNRLITEEGRQRALSYFGL